MLRAELREAMKRGDPAAVSALRTALAAVANAEAVPISSAPQEVRGTLADRPRRELDDGDVRRLLDDQVAEREATVALLAGRGQEAEVARLTAEAAVIRAIVSGRTPSGCSGRGARPL